MHHWMLTIDQFVNFYKDGNTEFLFCSRAGGRIKRLYDIYLDLEEQPDKSPGKVFWTSRIAACKGAFYRTPLECAEFLAKEFSATTLHDLLGCLLRQQPELCRQINWDDEDLAWSGGEFVEWLQKKTANVQVLLDYFVECEAAFKEQITVALAGRRRAVLIDSGWQGTTQWLLSGAYPEIEWRGLYFGRSMSVARDEPFTDQVIGTLFQADDYDQAAPETAIVHFRHLIESLLESPGPSIEEIAAGKFRNVAAELIAQNLENFRIDTGDPLFDSTCRYIRDQNRVGASLATIVRRYQAAVPQFERLVLFPTADEAIALGERNRSDGFGRELSLQIVRKGEAFADEHPDDRLARSLWKPGQIAVEFSPPEASERQKAWLASMGKVASLSPIHRLAEDNQALQKVAVITRTKERPLLLRRAAESIASQTYQNLVWVVINDAGDIAQIKQILENSLVDPRKILLIDKKSSTGMEAASNLGISASQSAYIAIHDDDDSWAPDFLEKTVEFLASRAGGAYGGVISKVVYVSEEIVSSGIIEHARAPYNDWVRSVDLVEMARENFFPPIAFLFRRQIYEKVGAFNEDLPVLGDWFFNLEFLLYADIGLIETTTAFYHHRDLGFSARSYSNSVIAEAKKHQEFANIARNRFFRKYISTKPAAAALLVSAAPRHNTAGGGLVHNPRPTPVNWENADNLNYGELEEEYDRLWLIDQLNRGYLYDQVDDFPTYRDLQVRADAALKDLLDTIMLRKIPVQAPRNFNERAYLERNADVAEACRGGGFVNGYIHYLAYGKNEGRRRFRNP
jgi:glycosyltransferase involved in cell wall biosynthesis